MLKLKQNIEQNNEVEVTIAEGKNLLGIGNGGIEIYYDGIRVLYIDDKNGSIFITLLSDSQVSRLNKKGICIDENDCVKCT